MPKYVLAYRGGGMPETEEEQHAVMAAWGAWYGELGAAVADGGNPFGPSCSIAPDGSVTPAGSAGLTGYTILDLASLDDAAAKAKGCPVLQSGGSVDVYETFDVMG
jgi:hypothetical protein